jgi:hypothetical protein
VAAQKLHHSLNVAGFPRLLGHVHVRDIEQSPNMISGLFSFAALPRFVLRSAVRSLCLVFCSDPLGRDPDEACDYGYGESSG